MDNRFQVEVSAGTMMSASATVARFPHRWTPGGVTVEAERQQRQKNAQSAAILIVMPAI